MRFPLEISLALLIPILIYTLFSYMQKAKKEGKKPSAKYICGLVFTIVLSIFLLLIQFVPLEIPSQLRGVDENLTSGIAIFFTIAFPLFIVLSGLWVLWRKYRIIWGGFFYQADVLEVHSHHSSRGSSFSYQVGFRHEGQYLKKTLINTTLYSKAHSHKTFPIYYNPKYPKVVIKKGFWLDIICIIWILAGLFLGSHLF